MKAMHEIASFLAMTRWIGMFNSYRNVYLPSFTRRLCDENTTSAIF